MKKAKPVEKKQEKLPAILVGKIRFAPVVTNSSFVEYSAHKYPLLISLVHDLDDDVWSALCEISDGVEIATGECESATAACNELLDRVQELDDRINKFLDLPWSDDEE